MTLKFPPPPTLPRDMQALNRWLIELQSILNSSGSIDPSSVDGLPAVITQVGKNTVSITTINGEIATINGEIVTINNEVAANTAAIAANALAIVALQARNQVLNGIVAPIVGLGNDGDWYSDTAAKHIYVKVAGAWVVIV